MKTDPARKFQELLLNYSQAEELSVRKDIEEKPWQEFGEEHTVFALDMSGFSLLTRKYGIVHYLSMVRRMELTTEPIIESFGGNVVKYEAIASPCSPLPWQRSTHQSRYNMRFTRRT